MTSLPPGVSDEELEKLLVESNASVACTCSLLRVLLTGEIVQPEVTYVELPANVGVESPEPDLEGDRLRQRLASAAQVLQKKRARTH